MCDAWGGPALSLEDQLLFILHMYVIGCTCRLCEREAAFHPCSCFSRWPVRHTVFQFKVYLMIKPFALSSTFVEFSGLGDVL